MMATELVYRVTSKHFALDILRNISNNKLNIKKNI